MFTVVHALVMAAGPNNYVPAGTTLYNRGAWMFADDLLRESGAP